ncbi:minor head protein [Lactobacillus johnsonii DPC 6026]|uniref:minor capsid protein n=1 Tax=Lactobacillus johnsonii TaxID=33959 RepID=UPI000207C019|nr:minor capsid protein [Lactobacillus johnsonii]AEB93127.1 minor head protein [Lactobacillus johnsonii DPC 6026]
MKIDKRKFTYWQLRDLQNEQQNQDEATKRLKIINSAYQKAQSYLSDEVQKIYRRYFYADISEQEVSDIMSSHISPSELVTLKALASNITDKESKKAIDDYLSRLAAKSRITRLEELRVKAYIAAKSSGDVELDQNIKLHTNVMKRTWDEVEKQGAVYDKAKDYKLPDTKIKPSVESKGNEVIIKNPETGKKIASVKMEQDLPKDKITEIPNRYVEAALNARWEGKNFSSRIWDNTDKLAERLQELFTTKELSNMSERDMIKQIAHEFNTSKFNASRLIRTEANFFYSKIKLDNWHKRGVERYQLLAVIDSRTSKICRSINGKIFKVRDAVFGKNMPPLHPFCRTVPVIYLGPKNNAVSYIKEVKKNE